MHNSKLIYFLLAALTIAVVALSVGMSWSLKLVRDLTKQAANVISGPSIDPNLSSNNAAKTEAELDAAVEEASSSAFLKLIKSSEPQSCSWLSTDLLGKKPLRVTLQTAENSFLLTMIENNFEQTTTFALRKGLFIYFWQEGQEQGYKLRSTQTLEGIWPEAEQVSIQLFSKVAADEASELTCLPFTGGENVFALPATVAFSEETTKLSPSVSPSPSLAATASAKPNL